MKLKKIYRNCRFLFTESFTCLLMEIYNINLYFVEQTGVMSGGARFKKKVNNGNDN